MTSILAMDPSLRNWGWISAELDKKSLKIKDAGIIRPISQEFFPKNFKKNEVDIWTVQDLQIDLKKVIAKTSPDIIGAELPTGSQTSRAQFSYAACLTSLAAICNTAQFIPLAPLTVKQFVQKRIPTEFEYPTKKEMIAWSYSFFKDSIPWKKRHGEILAYNEHIADASVVLALTIEMLNHPLESITVTSSPIYSKTRS